MGYFKFWSRLPLDEGRGSPEFFPVPGGQPFGQPRARHFATAPGARSSRLDARPLSNTRRPRGMPAR